MLVVKNPPANVDDIIRCGLDLCVRKIIWRRAWQPTPIFLPGELDRRSRWATVYSVTESQAQLKRCSLHTSMKMGTVWKTILK